CTCTSTASGCGAGARGRGARAEPRWRRDEAERIRLSRRLRALGLRRWARLQAARGPDHSLLQGSGRVEGRAAAGRSGPRQMVGVFGDPLLDALVGQVEISNQNVLVADARFRQALALAAASR